MEVGADVCSYRMSPEDIGYCELASAIVKMAIEDYREYRKTQLRHCESKSAQIKVEEVRSFFISELFECISNVENPIEFLGKLDERIVAEYEEECREGKRQKRRYTKKSR